MKSYPTKEKPSSSTASSPQRKSQSKVSLLDNRKSSHSGLIQMANQGKHALQLKALESLFNSSQAIQKQGLEKEELMQGKFEAAQREEIEDKELLQGKFETIQKMNLEEEEPLQGKLETLQKQGLEEEELMQGRFETAQKMSLEEEEPIQGKFETILKQENNTGLPDNLKSGIENFSGYSMDDVKVHYNSDKPATLQAHAYAQGTDIHIASGQEKHLPHEAWHVVQQKQGRVKPTLQMKQGVNLNDDAGLEKEADVIGAKALQMKRSEHYFLPSIKSYSTIAQVVQCRFPPMTKEQIESQPEVAKEILLHRIRTIDLASLVEMAKHSRLPTDPDVLAYWLSQMEPTSNTLYTMYQEWSEYITDDRRYVNEVAESTEPGIEMVKAIQSQLPSILAGIEETIQQTKVLTGIFGIEADKLIHVIDVFNLAKNAINLHFKENSCPIVIAGNRDHNEWIGAGGMTAEGLAQVELGLSGAKALAEGKAIGKALLVHEFTHSAAGTKDHAYGLASIAKLGPKKRVENAATYEHCFLEVTSVKNSARYYDPEVSSGKKKAGESESIAIKKKKAKDALAYTAELWNRLDNMYLAAQRLVAKEPNQGDKILASIGCLPHTLFDKPSTGVIGLALIEDRTHFLKGYIHNPITFLPYFKKWGMDKLRQMESNDIISEIVAEHFGIGIDKARVWNYFMMKPEEFKMQESKEN
ncbi:eCIS core domain-containing protein [Cognataquiflexum aquatile]|uniref:eCIS core domain-containing protein n=1 Tax=Cognataquiflexum aquatile TaxID=2249427 RepID=UPI00130028E8|nr:DUF4157 domain-containing protein [Cognataquiflexum aquatile]